jgi:cardiolipin synthase
VAWLVVIFAFPGVGVLAYTLLGETNLGRHRVTKMRTVLAQMPAAGDLPQTADADLESRIPDRYAHLFRVGQSVNGFLPVGGNQARLMKDSNSAINHIVEDIDAAQHHVHLIFYIWLVDKNGRKVAEALKRAALRGVTCRAMADGLGSRLLIESNLWKGMQEVGVRVAVALPVGNPVLRPLSGRIDLRNHRKVLVIDNRITYCGSQNCADPEFRIKAKYAPWVDVMVRMEGPVVRQNQYLFASDWMSHVEEDISDLLQQPLPLPHAPGFIAQVIGTGPTIRYSAMPEVFENLMYAARRELIVSTPYFVPDEAMQAALCACARRGVQTTAIFPAKNDSFVVAAASRSYYADLLAAGVRIFEYEGGLLHAKSLTLDGQMTLIGSANLDRRSFELNYENNILLHDPDLTAELRVRQQTWLADSRPVTPEMVATWSIGRRLWNNAIAMLGPVL